MNPNDEIRRTVLRYFYERNSHATSKTGKRGSAVKISDVKKELKGQHGLSQQEVISNLTYLIDNGWVKTIPIEKTVVVKGGTVPSTTTLYEITAKGIDRIEGGSQFEPQERYAGININATGSNVIALGDGNVVNVEYSQLRDSLDDLKEAVLISPHLTEASKLEAAVDIESIKDQLAKPRPNKDVISKLWEALGNLANIAALADLVAKAAPLIAHIIQAS